MLKFMRIKIGGFFDGSNEVRLWIYTHSAKYEILSMNFNHIGDYDQYEGKRLPVKNMGLLAKWDALAVNSWNDEYLQTACDGTQWELAYREDGKKTRRIYGSNAYPPNWKRFIEWLDALMPEMKFYEEIEEEEEDD